MVCMETLFYLLDFFYLLEIMGSGGFSGVVGPPCLWLGGWGVGARARAQHTSPLVLVLVLVAGVLGGIADLTVDH